MNELLHSSKSRVLTTLKISVGVVAATLAFATAPVYAQHGGGGHGGGGHR